MVKPVHRYELTAPIREARASMHAEPLESMTRQIAEAPSMNTVNSGMLAGIGKWFGLHTIRKSIFAMEFVSILRGDPDGISAETAGASDVFHIPREEKRPGAVASPAAS